jgi:TonB family protein
MMVSLWQHDMLNSTKRLAIARDPAATISSSSNIMSPLDIVSLTASQALRPFRRLLTAVLLSAGAYSSALAQLPPTVAASEGVIVQQVSSGQTPAIADSRKCAKPVWPSEALRNNQEGTVTLKFLIGIDGTVRESKVTKSSGFPLLDLAAQDAISKCKFKPGMKDGIAFEAWVPLEYVFEIEGPTRTSNAITAATRQSAERGDAEAQYKLSMIYLNGDGVERSLEQGMKWIRRAADQGHGKAQEGLGMLLQRGAGGQANLAEAAIWYRQAAEQGLPRAQGMLAQMLLNGIGIQRDGVEGMAWLRKSAGQGYAAAQTALGMQLLKADPPPAIAAEGMYWLRKAAAQHDRGAHAALGRCYELGRWVTQDYVVAAAMYDKAARGGNRSALRSLAGLYECGQGVPVDLSKAAQLRAAADAQPEMPPK